MVSTLEKWAENPAASLAVYAAMKRAYPIIPENSGSSRYLMKNMINKVNTSLSWLKKNLRSRIIIHNGTNHKGTSNYTTGLVHT